MLLEKIRKKGIKWFFWRLKSEFRRPTKQITKSIIDGWLRICKKISGTQKNNDEEELLYAIYDLKIAPITFNIADFLIVSEYEANKSGKKGFVIVFVPQGKPSSYGWEEYEAIFDSDSKIWKFHNIVLPITLLAPKCKGVYILPRRSDVFGFVEKKDVFPDLYDGVNLRYQDDELFRKINRPHMVEGLRATKQGLRYIEKWHSSNKIGIPVVTLTMRQSRFDHARNSNIEAWLKFAYYLQDSGYFPVIVPDTDNAFQTEDAFPELHVFNEGSWNMGLRMALYESSYLNFFSPNGPATLASLNARCSYISMEWLDKDSMVTTEESLRVWGNPINENYKFALPHQRLVFKRDTYENILAEFKSFVDDDSKLQFEDTNNSNSDHG